MEFNKYKNKYKKYKKILVLGLIITAAAGVALYAYFYFSTEKALQIIFPNGGEVLRAGKTYTIKWKARKVDKIGITLIQEGTGERKWIVRDFPAREQKYDWHIFMWEEPRQDYKISIFEYPWRKGKLTDYSYNEFTIIGPSFASCDQLSINEEWSFIPSDYPGLKKVFITKESWRGNLGGLEGADEKCQAEAEERGFEGSFKALLGDDRNLATERLNLEGVFVEAAPQGTLPQAELPPHFWQNFGWFLQKLTFSNKKEAESIRSAYQVLETYLNQFLEEWSLQQDKKTCHRLLGRNFNDFFKKFSDPLILNQEKFDQDFLKDFSRLWLGRIYKEDPKNCINILTKHEYDISKTYSFTSTCQEWKSDRAVIEGYPPPTLTEEIEAGFPSCYTPEGRRIIAAGIGGLASGLIGEENQIFTPSLGISCDYFRKLLCIQQ